MNEIAAANVPPLSELAMVVSSLLFLEANTLIINIPIMEQNSPRDAKANGRDMRVSEFPTELNLLEALLMLLL